MGNSSASLSEDPAAMGAELWLEWAVTAAGLGIDMTTSTWDKMAWIVDRQRHTMNRPEISGAFFVSSLCLVLVAGRTFNRILRSSVFSQLSCLALSFMWASQGMWMFGSTCTNQVNLDPSLSWKRKEVLQHVTWNV